MLAASAGLLLAGSTGARALAAPVSRDVIIANGSARFGGRKYKCAIGHGGIRTNKKEGDGATPAGVWPIRAVLYRADRVQMPKLKFNVRKLAPDDGWCDAPTDPMYNKQVKLPYPASAENLWRDDGLYDVVVVLGYNDDPVVPGLGSAIFMHVARRNYGPTLGCIAFAQENLLEILARATHATRVIVRKP